GDVSKGRSGSGYDHEVASSAIKINFNSPQLLPSQLFPEPDNARSHERSAPRAFWHLLLFLHSLGEPKIAALTPGNENVPVNLHHLVCPQTRARVEVIHVLRDEQD